MSDVFSLMVRQEETKRTLDMLRRSRIHRGGTGAPLQTPGGKEISPIIITDEDLADVVKVTDK